MQHRVDARERRLDGRRVSNVGNQVRNPGDRPAAETAELILLAQVLDGQAADQSAGAGNENLTTSHLFSLERTTVQLRVASGQECSLSASGTRRGGRMRMAGSFA